MKEGFPIRSWCRNEQISTKNVKLGKEGAGRYDCAEEM